MRYRSCSTVGGEGSRKLKPTLVKYNRRLSIESFGLELRKVHSDL